MKRLEYPGFRGSFAKIDSRWTDDAITEWERHHGYELPMAEFHRFAEKVSVGANGVRHIERRAAHRRTNA